MISLIFISVCLGASFYYTDLRSDLFLQGTLCPILVFIFLIALLVKIVVFLGPDSGRGGSGGDGGGYFGGGDGGCGGDGGSC